MRYRDFVATIWFIALLTAFIFWLYEMASYPGLLFWFLGMVAASGVLIALIIGDD